MSGSFNDLRLAIRKPKGLSLAIGPFVIRIQSSINTVSDGIATLYSDFSIHEFDKEFADFHISMKPQCGLRRWFYPQVHFYLDGKRPFKPLPFNHSYAFFEWGLNWCITMNAHQFMIMHAAVVEKGGFALMLPGAPGAGKSTLCAGLISRGWRLLSDELTMFPVSDVSQVVPVPRPVGLKNESINVIRRFSPDAIFGPVSHDTSKGTVVHLRPSQDSVQRSNEPAEPKFVVFPRYKSGSESQLIPRPKSSSFIEMARQSFNYNVLGETGFDCLTDVITRCDCYDFEYSDLNDAVQIMNKLVDDVTTNDSKRLARD